MTAPEPHRLDVTLIGPIDPALANEWLNRYLAVRQIWMTEHGFDHRTAPGDAGLEDVLATRRRWLAIYGRGNSGDVPSG